MEYKESTYLGYNYLKDRKLISFKPCVIEIEKELDGLEFKLDNIIESIKISVDKFIDSYKKFGYEINEGKLRYGYTNGMEGWPEYNYARLYVDLIGYETEAQFIKRKKKTKRTLEEQLLHETQVHLKEIEDAKEYLSKLKPDQLKEVLKDVNDVS